MSNIFEEVRQAVTREIRGVEDARVTMLLDLINAGVTTEDAEIAIDLHFDIIGTRGIYVAGPAEYVGKIPPIEESWARINAFLEGTP